MPGTTFIAFSETEPATDMRKQGMVLSGTKDTLRTEGAFRLHLGQSRFHLGQCGLHPSRSVGTTRSQRTSNTGTNEALSLNNSLGAHLQKITGEKDILVSLQSVNSLK
jgi:hypothetical protein